MYLKSIRAQGFKSFADKIDIEINPGITAIVGPNGSGKSNIVDAIRWVLGEQSVKSLRSSAMSDVIFNGSNSREKQKRAMVALVFDNSDHYLNSDFLEVEVKRVVYETGENEYYLNNNRVRLKDITDLFIESGAGLSDFNIISQGNITDIVNSKSTDRRNIFEATARVLKYKKRKEESLHKLDKTAENLLRIDLIIKELDQTMVPLKNESTKAEKYLAIKNDLEGIDIALICKDITDLNETYHSCQKEIEILQKQVENKDNAKELVLEKLKTQNLSLENKITEKREKLLDLTKKLSEIENERILTVERTKYNKDEKLINENLVKLKSDILNKDKDLSLINKEIEELTKELNTLKENIENANAEILKLKVQKSSLNNSFINKNKEKIETENKIEIMENNILTDASSPLPVRNILNNPRLNGIINTIDKLIKVDDAYLLALDTSLGANKNIIVTADEQAALEAIDFLKKEKLGRVTFYPLNVIKGRFIPLEVINDIKKMTGYIGVFKDLVEYDKKYQNIIERELGNVILTKDSLSMNAISKIVMYKYKVVSLDGEVANIGGSITGGISKNNNLIYQKNEINNLKNYLNSLNIEIKNLDEEINKLNIDIENLENKEEQFVKKSIALNEEINIKKELKNTLMQDLDTLKKEQEGMEDIVTNKNEDKLLTLMEEIKVVSLDKELLTKELNDLNKEKSDLNEEINIKEKEIKEENSLINNKLNELKNKEVLLGKTEVRLDNLLVNLNEEYNITYEYANSNYSLDLDYALAKEKVTNLKKELLKLGDVNVGSIEEYKRLYTRYEFLINQKDDLEKASAELKDIIKEMDEIMITKFKDTFNLVKKEFSRIFTLMFKGGHGELKLTLPNDILNTGVDIIAIPPGKKIASPLSLSGGEKALTAICLLFAMLEVRPSPFIVLDEAEAALDEANVDMFGKYLNNEKNKSQFIVITHKKRMMEYADTLYGITMQESGVSKIVSTKLEK